MQNRVELPRAISGEAIDGGRVTTPAAAGTNFLQDSSKRWATDIHKNRVVRITGGAGAGQSAVVQGNSAQGLVIKGSWTARLDTTSTYEIYGADIVTEFANLREALSRVLEVSEDSGKATGGSQTTVSDTGKNWGADMWQNAKVHVIKGGVEYVRACSSNTDDTLTIAALPAGISVGPGDDYAIRRPVSISDVRESLRDVLGAGADINAGNPLQTYDAFQKANLGDFTAQANLTSLLQALGVPDVAGGTLHDLLVTDRWDTRLSGARAARIDNLVGSEPSGTYSHPDDDLEHDVVEIVPAELTLYKSLLLDLSALTQDATIRTYIQVNGANYRLNDLAEFPTDFPTGTDAVALRLSSSSVKMKVTLQSTIAEGAVRDIPWRYSYSSWA